MTGAANLAPASIFQGLDPRGIVIVAVSGGSDSLALLLLANAWAASKDLTLHAVTVDHGLRPEAAAEAAFVASLCDALGIDHTTLAWDGIKPHSGIADAARRARYTLIGEFALEIGADLVLTGHTADDQAETIYMRVSRSRNHDKDDPAATGRGFSGMARLSRMAGGCQLARPLLCTSRQRLRQYLASFPQNWIEDPTNFDETFERVRIRKLMTADQVLLQRVLRFGKTMAAMRAIVSRDTATLLGATIIAEPGGILLFDYSIAAAGPRLVLVHALQVILAVTGGSEYLVPRHKVDDLLAALREEDFNRATLGNSVVERVGQKLRIYRERRNVATLWLGPGQTAVWDGRLEVINNGAKAIRIGPLTRTGLRELEDKRNGRLAVQPRAALLTCGVIGGQEDENWLPLVERHQAFDQVHVRQTARAIANFCPESDFPLLEWLRNLDEGRQERLQSRA